MQPHEIADVQPTFEQTILFIAFFSAIVLGFIATFRLFATMITHRTMRKAIDTNPQLAEGLLQKLTQRRERVGDDKVAIVLIAIGVAIALASVIASDDPGDIRAAMGAALFPLLVGGALWLRFRAVERAKQRDRSE